ncbi:hypothetical protein FB446DRAFT_795073 [Lentinula raphanica]|nr:hypothetical protein FB446DRAFT_795073 [Lentinula raphanica]
MSPFHSLTTIDCAIRDRNEHAAQIFTSAQTERKKKQRALGRKAPRLSGVADPFKVEDTIAVASDGTEVAWIILISANDGTESQYPTGASPLCVEPRCLSERTSVYWIGAVLR